MRVTCQQCGETQKGFVTATKSDTVPELSLCLECAQDLFITLGLNLYENGYPMKVEGDFFDYPHLFGDDNA